MNDLTCIIPFLNEHEEIEATVASIRETAGYTVEIMLVNDGSDPDFDYMAVARRHRCLYIQNDRRQGVAQSRNIGTERTTTPNVLLLDGHMRFYDRFWADRINRAIAENPRAIYCAACRNLKEGGVDTFTPKHVGYGAWISMDGPAFEDLIEPKWSSRVHPSSTTDTPVACILGAAYAFRANYMKRIGGLLGLQFYGADEAYLSIKAWLEGGSCRVLPDVEIGHIFRTHEARPYPAQWRHSVVNKAAIVTTLFPVEEIGRYFEKMKSFHEYQEARQIHMRFRDYLLSLRQYYGSIFRRPFSVFRALNEAERQGRDPGEVVDLWDRERRISCSPSPAFA